jgi:hypothetical protein
MLRRRMARSGETAGRCSWGFACGVDIRAVSRVGQGSLSNGIDPENASVAFTVAIDHKENRPPEKAAGRTPTA